jgi:hypothetical protein
MEDEREICGFLLERVMEERVLTLEGGWWAFLDSSLAKELYEESGGQSASSSKLGARVEQILLTLEEVKEGMLGDKEIASVTSDELDELDEGLMRGLGVDAERLCAVLAHRSSELGIFFEGGRRARVAEAGGAGEGEGATGQVGGTGERGGGKGEPEEEGGEGREQG